MASPCCNSVDYRKRFNGRSSAECSSEDSSSGKQLGSNGDKANVWLGDMGVEGMENLFDGDLLRKDDPALALVYVYGEWISPPSSSGKKDHATALSDRMRTWLRSAVNGLECQSVCGKLVLTEDSVDDLTEIPPAELPALAIASRKGHASQSIVQYLSIKPATLQEALGAKSSKSSASIAVKQAIQNAVRKAESDMQLSVAFEKSQGAIRIFIAGDRSSVGKSSVCL